MGEVIYVLYHDNCYDGFGAAYAAWKKFDSNAKYIPVSYGNPLPDMSEATRVYIVDFSYPKQTLLNMVDAGLVVTVLDHHKTAQEDLECLIGKDPRLHIVFDMNRSGAKIAWEYFHSGPDGSVPYNRLIEHISDRDLWKFEMRGSKEVHAALVSTPFDFEVWDKLDVDQLIIEGSGALKFQTQLVKNIVSKAWISRIADWEVPIVNTASSWSEVGEALLETYPNAPFAASFTNMKNSVMWSLRSKGDFDVSEVAKKFGGGGHKNAAGFKSAKF